MAFRPHLRALAEQSGIVSSYRDQAGRPRSTSDDTRAALLAAMGIDVPDEPAARAALAVLRAQRGDLSPVRVADRRAARVVRLGPASRAVQSWTVEVECEDGATLRVAGRRRAAASLRITLPALPLGYHRLRLLTRRGDGREQNAEQWLIVVPPHCVTVPAGGAGRRVFGLLTNLYTVRSAQNWGVGDCSDLRRLVRWAGVIGAAFVGVNPLHALANRGDHISPYSPLTRLFRNPLYLDATAAPEWRALSVDQRTRFGGAAALARWRRADRLDYAAVAAHKQAAIGALHRVFVRDHAARETARGRAYRAYVAAQGEPLAVFATFLALAEHFASSGAVSWRDWPRAYRDPASAAVRAFAAAHPAAVDRHRYVQFELDRQLATVADEARDRALPIGIYQDLALGSSRDGSDVWAYRDVFLERASIGAPPDDYSRSGQNWQLPPLDPRALRASGYAYWVRLLRSALRHAGALRIDHVMGLFRQYWIPAGAEATDGAYVRFPSADLLGILALESHRAGAIIIGEDLGTVPRGLPRTLRQWGILSTRVLYFERTRRGGFRPARTYPRQALVGANTHDLIPLAGYWSGRDIALRAEMGLLSDPAAAQAERARDRAALVRRLRRDRFLPAGGGHPDELSMRAAVHAFLATTPSALLGISLDDCSGEELPVNQPGAPLDVYPSWSRRMQMSVERLTTDRGVARTLAGVRRRRALSTRPPRRGRRARHG
jgi:4-alpha-glucanotransferase